MESLGADERLVATVVRVVKTGLTGKGVGTSCSRIDTDNLGVFHRRLGPGERARGVAGPGMTAVLGMTVGLNRGKDSRNVIRFLSKTRVK